MLLNLNGLGLKAEYQLTKFENFVDTASEPLAEITVRIKTIDNPIKNNDKTYTRNLINK